MHWEHANKEELSSLSESPVFSGRSILECRRTASTAPSVNHPQPMLGKAASQLAGEFISEIVVSGGRVNSVSSTNLQTCS